MTRSTVRTARRVRFCDDCGHAIAKGERYVAMVASPNHDDLGNPGWWPLNACLNCSGRYMPPELRAILSHVYTPDGVVVWWRGGNQMLGGKSPSTVWYERRDPDQVMALAEQLLGQVAS